MQQIINFFIRNQKFLLFIVLFSVAFNITLNNNPYQSSAISNILHPTVSKIFEWRNAISSFWNLQHENNILIKENNRLNKLLFNQEIKLTEPLANVPYDVLTSKIIKNSFNLRNNYLTIVKGSVESVKVNNGVINSIGVVGVVDKVSDKYSRVLSILSEKTRLNAKLKNTNYFGIVSWDTNQTNIVQLNDIQDLVPLKKGDTIVTSGYSAIFPENIPIGTVADFRLNETQDLYIIDVKLFNDMRNLSHIYLIQNKEREELQKLATENE